MYKSEQINDNSYKDIQLLYRLSFGSKHSIKFINSKYDTSNFGLKNIGILAKSEENEPAAFYGVFPMILKYDAKDYLVAQSGDTMTAPNHRKKGLFTKLAKATYELSEKKGIKLVFGFPNKNSYPGFQRKLNWVFHGFMQKFTLPTKTIPFCELASKLPSLQPLYNKYAKFRISKYEISADQIKLNSFNFSNVKGLIKKDAAFFEYKTRKEEVYLIQIDGFSLLIKVKIHLYIGEIGRIEKEQIKPLLKSIKKIAKRLGCKKTIFTLSENHWMYPILKEEIEPEESLPIGFYLIDKSLDVKEIQFSNADYDTF